MRCIKQQWVKIISLLNEDLFDRHNKETVYLSQINDIFKSSHFPLLVASFKKKLQYLFECYLIFFSNYLPHLLL